MTENMCQNYYPDPSRIVNLEGPFVTRIIGRLLADIRALKQQSNRPITIYIKSGGGHIDAFYELDDVINPRGVSTKRLIIITVAQSAKSAAAYLLVAGHSAYALKNARLHFHGVRTRDHLKINTLTWERALTIALRLGRENSRIARTMAARVAFRLAARHRRLLRDGDLKPNRGGCQTFLKNFAKVIRQHLLTLESCQAWQESVGLLKLISLEGQLSAGKAPANQNLALLEAKIIQGLMRSGREVPSSHKWTAIFNFTAELMASSLLACLPAHGDNWPLVRKLAESLGPDFLGTKEARRYTALGKTDPAKARAYLVDRTLPYSLMLWGLALALSHRLLLGSQSLSPADAYWLGLIDAVIDDNVA